MDTTFRKKIERIICPFDFTSTGRVGLEYAGMLAKALSAQLTILYVQPSIWPEALQLYEDRNDSTKGIKRLIQLEAKGIEDIFGVKADFLIEPTTNTIEMTIGAVAVDYDLVVMGTNGADDLFQHVFGSDSYHVLGLTHCPVLIVPEGYGARIPRLIVYALDPESNPVFLVDQLENLAVSLKAEVRTLNVMPESGAVSDRKADQLGLALRAKRRKGFDWNFEPVYADNIGSAIDDYMKVNHADMLALSYHHRNLFERLFKENVIREISEMAGYPVLVFWH